MGERDEKREALIRAIRAFTVEAPDDQPNGKAEKALRDLDEALNPGRWPKETFGGLAKACDAAANLNEALADNVRALRIAAEEFFGGDFRAQEGGPSDGR